MQAAHPQDLSRMAILQPQKVIHDSLVFCGICSPTQVHTNLIIGVRQLIWRLTSWLTRQPDVELSQADLSVLIRSPPRVADEPLPGARSCSQNTVFGRVRLGDDGVWSSSSSRNTFSDQNRR